MVSILYSSGPSNSAHNSPKRSDIPKIATRINEKKLLNAYRSQTKKYKMIKDPKYYLGQTIYDANESFIRKKINKKLLESQ